RLLAAAPAMKAGLTEALAIIRALYQCEPIGAAWTGDDEAWRGCRKDMPAGMTEVNNQAGVHPDELLPILERLTLLATLDQADRKRHLKIHPRAQDVIPRRLTDRVTKTFARFTIALDKCESARRGKGRQ